MTLCDVLAPTVVPALEVVLAGPSELRAYEILRRDAFVRELGLFAGSDRDDRDDNAVVVIATLHGAVVGGVRLFEVSPGWWQGGRLTVHPSVRGTQVGRTLVEAACVEAEARGALRFEATVLPRHTAFFTSLGWQDCGDITVAEQPHVLMRWPVGRVARLVTATKRALGGLLEGLSPGGRGFVGDDCAPVPGSSVLASVDAILPSMVADDPEWAGWCGVLVGANDLAAMGAVPSGLLDSLASPSAAHAAQVLSGLRAASQAFRLPVLGGHTQLGVPAALSVTALGTATAPVPGAGRAGQSVCLTADLNGSWRAGHEGRQWDSTSRRSSQELTAMTTSVAQNRPAAAKDVSMAGVVGTLGMLAEASGCGAELDVASVPRPVGATVGDWFTCFPGFAMLTTGEPMQAGPAVSAQVGSLVPGTGVRLRWPDGVVTEAVAGAVTGLGTA